MLRLYTYFRSSAAYRVRIALALKGLAYESVPVHLLRGGGEQLQGAYRAVNPAALVPALQDDDATLTQSLAILEYLEETHPAPALLPQGAVGRARVRALAQLVDVNITATLLLLKQLLPRVLGGRRPQLVLTGSTSALPRSGRPEVAFGASKFALNGIADALREGYRQQRLAVTTLQLGYLNTDDALSVPLQQAAARGNGAYVPVHDVVAMVRALLQLSPSSFVRELVLPAIADPRY